MWRSAQSLSTSGKNMNCKVTGSSQTMMAAKCQRFVNTHQPQYQTLLIKNKKKEKHLYKNVWGRPPKQNGDAEKDGIQMFGTLLLI